MYAVVSLKIGEAYRVNNVLFWENDFYTLLGFILINTSARGEVPSFSEKLLSDIKAK